MQYEYRTSEQQAEEARYHQECAEAAARQRAEAETPSGPPLTETEAARLDAEVEQTEGWISPNSEYVQFRLAGRCTMVLRGSSGTRFCGAPVVAHRPGLVQPHQRFSAEQFYCSECARGYQSIQPSRVPMVADVVRVMRELDCSQDEAVRRLGGQP